MLTSLNKILNEPQESCDEYLETLSRFRDLTRESNLTFDGIFDDQHAKRFEALIPARQHLVHNKLKLALELLEGSVRLLGHHPSHFYLRKALKKFDWKIDPSVFEMINAQDTVEIYGSDLTLKVANIRFFELCSYSLEEVLNHEFFDLFQRDSNITEKIISNWGRIAKGEIHMTSDLGPDHITTEAFSIRHKQFWVESKILTAVYDRNKNVIGGLYSAKVTVLNSPKPQAIALLDV